MTRAAWEVELLKLRRSPVARTSALVLVLGTAGLSAAFTAVGLGDGESQMAVKVRPMLQGEGWEAYLGMLGQILSVAMLLCVGVVVSWVVGREFTDGTIGSLLALPTPPRAVAMAKLGLVVLGGVACSVGAVLLALPAGALIGLGPPDLEALRAAGRVVLIGLLTTALALPVAAVASVRRGYLPGVGALLGLVVVTQVVTVAGAGGWFPWAAPGLWSGMGGAEAAAAVTTVQLLLPLLVGIAGAALTVGWWARAELR